MHRAASVLHTGGVVRRGVVGVEELVITTSSRGVVGPEEDERLRRRGCSAQWVGFSY